MVTVCDWLTTEFLWLRFVFKYKPRIYMVRTQLGLWVNFFLSFFIFLSFFLSLFPSSFSVWPLLPTHCRCSGLLSHLITLVTPHSVGLLNPSHRPPTRQHTTFRLDSKEQSQQASGCKPTPLTAATGIGVGEVTSRISIKREWTSSASILLAGHMTGQLYGIAMTTVCFLCYFAVRWKT
jgi:hypothetical protein